jgi:TRAP-type C4-dicarboxylate transport system permease small subunit
MTKVSSENQGSHRGGMIVRWLNHLLGFTAALIMFTMMLVTFVDVVGRSFDYPLPGGFEITEILLAALIFIGLPLVTAEGGHVEVDLLDSVIPNWFKTFQTKMIAVINIIALGSLSWLMLQFAIRTYKYQDTTAVLEIPFAGLTFLMFACSTLATMALIVMLFTGRSRLIDHNNDYQT